jgi:hypothetical protein
MSEYQLIAILIRTLESNICPDNNFKSNTKQIVDFIKLSCRYYPDKILPAL